MSDVRLLHIPEPMLAFWEEQEAESPKDGLFLFGPPASPQHPAQLRYGIIGHAAGIQRLLRWMEAVRGPLPPKDPDRALYSAWPGFEAAFRCSLPEAPIARIEVDEHAVATALRIADRHEAIYRTVGLYESPIIAHLQREEVQPTVWFVVIPEEVHRLGRPRSPAPPRSERTPSQIPGVLPGRLQSWGRTIPLFPEDREVEDMRLYARHFHNQLKARLLRHRVAIQVVRETTIAPEDFLNTFGRPIRKVEDATTIAWNLCTTAFFKAEGKPWQLAHIRKGACYIGLVFKQDPAGDADAKACCGAQMFLDSGDGIVFRGAIGRWWRRDLKEHHLDETAARDIVSRVVAEYRRLHGDRPPSELFIHGRAAFTEEEWRGFQSAIDEQTKLVGVRIQQSSDIKLFSPGKRPLMRGAALPMSATSAYLWTLGYVPRLDTYPGWEVPRPIKVEVLRGSAPLEVVLADVMGLTKLNYNSAAHSATLPVTLAFADAVGEILMAIPEEASPVPLLPFRYYI